MPSNYAGTNTLHGQIVIPSDGDPAIAESVGVTLRALMDNSVYANTELAHKLDDRGGTYTLSTDNLVIQGAQNLHLNVDTFFGDDTTFGATGLRDDHVLSVYDELRVRGTSNLRYNVNIGSGPSQDLNVYATTTFREPVSFLDDVTLGNGESDPITINGALRVENPSTFSSHVQLGTVGDHTITVGGTVVAQEDITAENDLTVEGSLTAGNSSTDAHTFRGAVTFRDDVTLQSADLEVGGDLTVTGNATIGNTSGDDLTVEADTTINGSLNLGGALISAMTFSGLGRVPGRAAQLTTTTTLTVQSGNLFSIFGQAPAFSQTYTFADTDAADGDWALFAYRPSFGVNVSFPSAGSFQIDSTTPLVLAFRVGGVWRAWSLTTGAQVL